MTTGMPLYHFTDTVRLPWIVDSGQLNPGRNKVGGYPAPDFLCATSDPSGDGSAAMERAEGYRSGLVWHVRFTLNRDQFFPWSEVPVRYPSWTPRDVERLERVGRKMKGDPANWWCRTEPLPLTEASEIYWRSYTNNRWSRLPVLPRLVTAPHPAIAVMIGDRVFASQRVEMRDGRWGYVPLQARVDRLR